MKAVYRLEKEVDEKGDIWYNVCKWDHVISTHYFLFFARLKYKKLIRKARKYDRGIPCRKDLHKTEIE